MCNHKAIGDTKLNAFQPNPDDPALELVGNKTPITLKNIQYSARASKRTHHFNATIYIDDERALKAFNSGRGNPNQYYHTHGQSHEAFMHQFHRALTIGVDYVQDKESKLSMEEYWNQDNFILGDMTKSMTRSLDWLITDLMNEHLILKEMRNAMKKRTIFYDKRKKGVYHIKQKPTPDALAHCRRENVHALFFNDLPEAEAYYYWRKI